MSIEGMSNVRPVQDSPLESTTSHILYNLYNLQSESRTFPLIGVLENHQSDSAHSRKNGATESDRLYPLHGPGKSTVLSKCITS